MRLEELQYDLPPELIAQRPATRRDAARLLVLHRDSGRTEHRTFRDIVEYIEPGDGLVLNNTRVIPARFFCRRRTGGRIEALFLHETDDGWRVLLKPSGRLKVNERLCCEGTDIELNINQRYERGEWFVHPEPNITPVRLLEQIGQTPLPPYIRNDAADRHGQPDDVDRQRYQTVYAAQPGAVAAPTAGLHFTPELLEQLQQAGVRPIEVTLHVGLGTFAPIEAENLSQHEMHAEWFDVCESALATLREVRAAGHQIVAVGTTAVRVLESLPNLTLKDASNWTDIFIYPPYDFRHVDRLLTNFHLPGSTLLALVMAFANPEQIRRVYQEAILTRYRFYSYGDAMLIY